MHLSLWFVTKFMTVTTAAVNASVRNEKKNTSQGPALFRSGKQAPRRRQPSKRIPYSALFPFTHPACELRDYIKWPVPAWPSSSCPRQPELEREDRKPGRPRTTDLLPAWSRTLGGSMDARRSLARSWRPREGRRGRLGLGGRPQPLAVSSAAVVVTSRPDRHRQSVPVLSARSGR